MKQNASQKSEEVSGPALSIEEVESIAVEESTRWRETYDAIVREIQTTHQEYLNDRKVAMELTAEMVAATREEDAVQIASDEAVAHGLTQLRREKSGTLQDLAEQPYFARVVTLESGKEIEFRLGTASFPDCRIIDWRKAPIARLYYDYKEGDDFGELIQGKDREGIIKLRRSYQGKRSDLFIVELPSGSISRENGKWKWEGSREVFSRGGDHDGHLPPILSLITPEQYSLITRDPKKPMVIQGIAGSGKTTVALHRLAWLLHEDNGGLDPRKCLVVMFNRSLRNYIETTLPELGIPGVPIRTLHQWAQNLVKSITGEKPAAPYQKPRDLEIFKSSGACLDALLEFTTRVRRGKEESWVSYTLRFCRDLLGKDIFWPKWDVVKSGLREQLAQKGWDIQDDIILLHLVYAENGYYPAKTPDAMAICDHIVVDEVQDFGVMEIRALLNALDNEKTVTLVGDSAQKIVMGRNFESWERLLQEAGFEETTPVSLAVSHRTTQEILALASYVRRDPFVKQQAQQAKRHGPDPVFLKVQGIEVMAHTVGKWLQERLKENNRSLSCVICRWPKEAQRLVEELRKLGLNFVRLGHRDQFDFAPGVIVTNVHQVKGLEFRNVLVVEPSEANYSAENEEERNLLYVALTRAEWRLDFIGSQPVSSLLPKVEKST